MAKRKIIFTNGEIYHIVLRSVEGIQIFRDDNDRFRAIFGLYEFNNEKPVNLWKVRRLKTNHRKEKSGRGPTSPGLPSEFQREMLVEMLAFCLMPNHIHLLLRQIKDQGITNFIRKFATGYAMYFNSKYQRKGHLFQGNFLAVHIKDEAQLSVVFVYIHVNPISVIFPRFKEEGIKDAQKAMEFLKNYKWSSFQDYIGKKNFPSLTQREFLLKVLNGKDRAEQEIWDYLIHKKEFNKFQPLTLE